MAKTTKVYSVSCYDTGVSNVIIESLSQVGEFISGDIENNPTIKAFQYDIEIKRMSARAFNNLPTHEG